MQTPLNDFILETSPSTTVDAWVDGPPPEHHARPRQQGEAPVNRALFERQRHDDDIFLLLNSR